METELDKVGGELGVLGRDTEVGAHRQTEARTHCRSLWRHTGLGLAGPRHDPYDSGATHVDRRNDGHGQTANGEEPVGHDHKTPTSGRETGAITRVSGKRWKRVEPFVELEHDLGVVLGRGLGARPEEVQVASGETRERGHVRCRPRPLRVGRGCCC